MKIEQARPTVPAGTIDRGRLIGVSPVMESRTRSLVKALSWQFLGLFTMSAIGFAFTGSLSSGGALALASAGISFFTYLVHERAWAGVGWGKQTPREAGAVGSTIVPL